MTITLYYNHDEPDVVDKRLTPALTDSLTGVLREETSMLRPAITIGLPASSLTNANYAYISEFGRYYYIEDKVSIRTDLTQLIMRVDPLMSFKAALLQTSVLVKRNSYSYNLKLNDGSLVAYSDGYVLAYPFSGGFNTESYVLITAGGS